MPSQISKLIKRMAPRPDRSDLGGIDDPTRTETKTVNAPSFATSQDIIVKSLRSLSHGEVFRTSDDGLAYAFKWGKASEAYPWTHLIDLNNFSALNYRDGLATAPDFAYSLGVGNWTIRLGGEDSDCRAGRRARPGDILVDASGMWLIAGHSGALYRYGLAGEADRKRLKLGEVSGMLFERWSICSGDGASAISLKFDSSRTLGAETRNRPIGTELRPAVVSSRVA